MALTKSQRKEIWNKSDGHCWYCGCVLPAKGWHADHVKPVHRDCNVLGRTMNDNMDNIVPSCSQCNLFKKTFELEAFRDELSKQVERARKTSVNFRFSEKFGQIQVTETKIVFWFEGNIKSSKG